MVNIELEKEDIVIGSLVSVRYGAFKWKWGIVKAIDHDIIFVKFIEYDKHRHTACFLARDLVVV